MNIPPELEAKILAAEGTTVNGRPWGIPQPVWADEAEFMADVIRHAKDRGWMVYHTRDSRKCAAGFPDLILVRGPVIHAWELKMPGKVPTAAQLTWLECMAEAGVKVAVRFPDDWPQIVKELA